MLKSPCKIADETDCRGQLILLSDSEAGFSMIEVVVSILLVALIASAAATALISSGRLSADQRRRSQAENLAQQDQDRMRGMSTKQLANLNQTRTITLDGTDFSVTSTGRYLSSSSEASSCTSSGAGSVDYLRAVSSVTWSSNKRPPVTAESVIAPSMSGALLTQVQNENAAPLTGATVSATGPDSESALTDADGCTIFGGLAPGDYAMTISRVGYVDINGNASISATATVSGSGTSFPTGNPLKLGQAGAISVTNLPSGSPTSTFRAQMATGTVVNGQLAPAMSWYGSGTVGAMSSFVSTSTSQPTAPMTPAAAISTPSNLFPFSNASGYTNNYVVWSGNCLSNEPPTASLSYATVLPGASANPVVTEPAMNVKVTYAGTRVKPDHPSLLYVGSEPSPYCYAYSFPAIAANASSATGNGALASPGQPFATSGSPASASGLTGTYYVCADYDPSGSTTARELTVQTTNSNFTTATVVNVALTSSSSSGTC